MCFVWMKHSIELICDLIWILICGDSVECIGVNRIKSHFQTIKLDWEKKNMKKKWKVKKSEKWNGKLEFVIERSNWLVCCIYRPRSSFYRAMSSPIPKFPPYTRDFSEGSLNTPIQHKTPVSINDSLSLSDIDRSGLTYINVNQWCIEI